MKEKRKFSRYNLENEVNIKFENEERTVSMIDIGLGGMRVSSKMPLEQKKQFRGQLHILPNSKPFFVKGKVAWSAKEKNLHLAGLIFDKVSTIPINS
jgi:hypothetical protein